MVDLYWRPLAPSSNQQQMPQTKTVSAPEPSSIQHLTPFEAPLIDQIEKIMGKCAPQKETVLQNLISNLTVRHIIRHVKPARNSTEEPGHKVKKESTQCCNFQAV
jgi:hypothetical protein